MNPFHRTSPPATRRRAGALALLLSCTTLIATACGGDDDDELTPTAKCERLTTTYCDKVVDCGVEVGAIASADRDTTYDQCIAQIESELACEDAVAVGDTYDQCIDDIEGTPCDVALQQIQAGNPVPDTCSEVILLSEE